MQQYKWNLLIVNKNSLLVGLKSMQYKQNLNTIKHLYNGSLRQNKLVVVFTMYSTSVCTWDEKMLAYTEELSLKTVYF